jgi:anaerobic selenocysteine-containing dehydrogenase
MALTEKRSFCRLCLGFCGVRLWTDEHDRLVEVRGDKDHAMTAGYACIKGLAAPELHNGLDRILRPLKRQADGGFQPIALETALDEIAAQIARLVAEDGPDAVAVYTGTQAAFNAALTPMSHAWMQALGSKSRFSTMTVDQSAKWVAAERLGAWGAGHQTWIDADVWMFFGTNPLVSVVGGVNGFVALNPTRRIQEAKARGMKLIVADPRRTETARYADAFLQLRPGEDVTLAAGMLRMILAEGWEDRDFCARNVRYLEELRRAVEPFTPDYVEARAGVAAADLAAATAMFAQGPKRGCAFTGTGPSMSPRSNLAEHMVQSLNVVCGRFVREGEPIANPGAAGRRQAFHAEAYSPRRAYETTPRGRVGDYGLLFGEMMSCTLADEVLTPGPGRIRAIVSSGANPVATLPDQEKVVRAFKALDLLVAIEPYMTSTAKLSHYILPPVLIYERADLPLVGLERALYPEPFAQFTPAVARPPAGSEVVDDWYVFWALARRLGLSLTYDGVPLDMTTPPTTEDLIALLLRDAIVPFEEIRAHPAGAVFRGEARVAAPPSAAAGRFEVAPPDVAEELAAVAAEPVGGEGDPFTHRLVVRRIRETENTLGTHLAAVRRRKTYNAVQVHPGDLSALGFADGDRVNIVSRHGQIPAILEADDTLRLGVASMAHGWGGLPEENLPYETSGASPTALIDSAERETINGMARLSSIPVRFAPRS